MLRVDFAGRGPFGQEPIVGAPAVMAAFRATAGQFAPYGRPATVNGAPGVATIRNGRLVAAVAMSIVGGRIREIDIVADPAKLR